MYRTHPPWHDIFLASPVLFFITSRIPFGRDSNQRLLKSKSSLFFLQTLSQPRTLSFFQLSFFHKSMTNKSINQIMKKSMIYSGVFGIRALSRRMEGPDEPTEQWQPKILAVVVYKIKLRSVTALNTTVKGGTCYCT